MAWGSRAGSGSLFAHQIIFSATSLMSLDGFCKHYEEERKAFSQAHPVCFSKQPRLCPDTLFIVETDPTAPLRCHPHCGRVITRCDSDPILFHFISCQSLLCSPLSAHVGIQLLQTHHAASCLGPLHWLVPLPGTCLAQILVWLVPSHPSGLSSNVSL